jgi:hypothetical protein
MAIEDKDEEDTKAELKAFLLGSSFAAGNSLLRLQSRHFTRTLSPRAATWSTVSSLSSRWRRHARDAIGFSDMTALPNVRLVTPRKSRSATAFPCRVDSWAR